MNAETRKMLLRSIRGSLGRFLAILAIVALGVGFYAGIKSSQPDMLRSADDYLHGQKMYDFRLMSSLGLVNADVAAFRRLPGVEAAEGARFADAYARLGEREEEVWHFETLTTEVAVPELTAGRLPEKPGECLGDAGVLKESDLGLRFVLTESNSEDTFSRFAQREFELVGLARSPRYISLDRGSSELGSGKPAGFVLLPGESFADGVFHELLLWCNLPGAIYSEEYSDAVRHLRPSVDTLLNQRGVLHSRQLQREEGRALADARDELDRGWSEYRLGLQQSARELAAAEKKLQSAQDQLDIGRAALEQNEQTLAETEAKLAADRSAYNERVSALTEKTTQVATLRAELTSVGVERLALEARKTGELSSYATQLATLYAQILVLQIDPVGNAAAIEALEQQRAQAQAALDAAQAALENPQPGDPTWYVDGLRSLDEREANCRDQLAAIDESGLSEEAMSLATQLMELQMTESLLSESRGELASARAELENGAAELARGRTEYEKGKEEADRELADAKKKLEEGEKELAEGEKELETALRPELFTLDRTANAGYVTFENDSAIIDGLAVVFPVFFVLVAGLVCVTTMTRMVNEERTQIGTLKALGYSSPAITAKYLLYAGLSALLGCVLGFYLGCTGLPYIVWFAYSIMYQYADLRYSFSSLLFVACLLVSVAGSLFVTWLACRSALREKPAELIRPKAPAVGKRVLLERIGPLWRRMPFLSKVSIRNAFRYPSRVFMMLLGIGGCTALIIAGFGVRDSLTGVGDYQYDEISLYDVVVMLDAEKAGPKPEALWADWAQHAALTHREEIRLQSPEGDGKDTDLILADAGEIAPLLSLHTKAGTVLDWPGPGEAVITKKLSDTLGLKAGDRAVLQLADGTERGVLVTGVCEYFIGHAVFCPKYGFPDSSGNYGLIRVRDGEDAGRCAAMLRSGDGVRYVSLTQTERETLASSMASLDLLVLMLVFCAGALAFITLYNLTNINIMERIREVATVKVLGFTPRETAQYILNENLMLSFFGAALGLLLGKLLHRFVMNSVNLDYMSYDIRIAARSYALSLVITLAFALLTNLFMRRKLEKVNMAESLKSVE